jgi:hypothetical protein
LRADLPCPPRFHGDHARCARFVEIRPGYTWKDAHRGEQEEGSEPGRHPNQGTKGADRPYGTADSDSASSVAGQDNIDENMPDMPPGDQGG